MSTYYERFLLLSASLALGSLLGCASVDSSKSVPSGRLSRQSFGQVDGMPVDIFTLRNTHGTEVKICNYGGIITSFKVPDRNGHMGDVVLGYDNLNDYVKNNPYFGCLVGRYG